jgi:predicted Rossmann fold nucleotide-binding protein DprA/Smf involved in DNA uptake
MKVGVIGSRIFDNYEKMKEVLSLYNITEIISGGARGADKLAETYAKENNIPITIFNANWKDISHPNARIKYNAWGEKFDANAGLRRNKVIVNNSDIIIAFWDNVSKGTKDSVTYANKVNKEVVVIVF